MSTGVTRTGHRGTTVRIRGCVRCLEACDRQNVLLTGTCAARGGNELLELAYGDGATSLHVRSVYNCEQEIWDICGLKDGANNAVAVATRSGAASAIAVWELDPAEQCSPLLSSQEETKPVMREHKVLANYPVDEKVKTISLGRDSLIVTTARSVLLMNAVGESQSFSSPKALETSNGGTNLVGAVYNESAGGILVAAPRQISFYDLRCSTEASMNVFQKSNIGGIQENARTNESIGQGTFVADTITSEQDPRNGGSLVTCNLGLRDLHLSAIATDGGTMLACGDEDGDIYVIDLRKLGHGQDNLLWTVSGTAAHAHYITSLAVEATGVVISGSTDGVVRAWDNRGEVAGTFPIHDDTVYGIAWLRNKAGFASVSYDGRVAANVRPVGFDN